MNNESAKGESWKNNTNFIHNSIATTDPISSHEPNNFRYVRYFYLKYGADDTVHTNVRNRFSVSVRKHKLCHHRYMQTKQTKNHKILLPNILSMESTTHSRKRRQKWHINTTIPLTWKSSAKYIIIIDATIWLTAVKNAIHPNRIKPQSRMRIQFVKDHTCARTNYA